MGAAHPGEPPTLFKRQARGPGSVGEPERYQTRCKSRRGRGAELVSRHQPSLSWLAFGGMRGKVNGASTRQTLATSRPTRQKSQRQ